jgi:hypothetical protein
VLLVSSSFLASKFISEVELPALLRAADSGQLKVCWVVVSDCLYQANPNLSKFQAAHDPAEPLDSLTKPKKNTVLKKIARTIHEQYTSAMRAQNAIFGTDVALNSQATASLESNKDDHRSAQNVGQSTGQETVSVANTRDYLTLEEIIEIFDRDYVTTEECGQVSDSLDLLAKHLSFPNNHISLTSTYINRIKKIESEIGKFRPICDASTSKMESMKKGLFDRLTDLQMDLDKLGASLR